jgi:hypothetical protein
MDREYIDAHNVAERYVLGQLTPEERDAFEERLVWCKPSQDDVRRAELLRDGLRDVVASRYGADSPPGRRRSPLPPPRCWRSA